MWATLEAMTFTNIAALVGVIVSIFFIVQGAASIVLNSAVAAGLIAAKAAHKISLTAEVWQITAGITYIFMYLFIF